MKKIILKPGKEKPFLHQEPLVFSGAIQSVEGEPQVAELVSVCDSKENIIGMGFFNPYSSYRVRIISFVQEKLNNNLSEILDYRFQEARLKRAALKLPNDQTNTYRLFNSEADGLSGIIIDVFNQYAVVASSAYWVEENKTLILTSLKRQYSFEKIIWRPTKKSLAQDGWKQTIEAEEKLAEKTTVRENNLLYNVDLSDGQKTGFYCDQRENRLIVRRAAKKRKVLDCFCYSGGFAFNAFQGGAERVVGIDSSAAAIDLANENAVLNHMPAVQFEKTKAEDFLAQAENFDFIILDPPKLSPSQKDLGRAKQYYYKLNKLALKALPKNGLLFSCSCSDAVTQAMFLEILKKSASSVGKSVRILEVCTAGKDHPSLAKSRYGGYLKAVLLEVY